MDKQFADHFGSVATNYAEFRPTYPEELFIWLADIAPTNGLAWDCACGSGQASVDLAYKFQRVIATDASESQIQAAIPHPRVEYEVASAEFTGIEDASVDLVSVAQALHWFDLEKFYAEVRRVLKENGVLAVWSYGIHKTGNQEIDSAVWQYYTDTVGSYWPPERKHVENGYADLAFPFTRIQPPSFTMTASWSLQQFLGYLRSWSATGRYIKKNGHDPVIELTERLLPLWGDPISERRVTWPLLVLAGRNLTPNTSPFHD